MSKVRQFAVRTGALVLALALSGVVLVSLAGTPAQAARLGEITLQPASGKTGTVPAFTTATTDKGCPETHKDNVALKIGPLNGTDGDFKNLNRIASDPAGYAGGPFSLNPRTNQSMDQVLDPDGAEPYAPLADGDYLIVIQCVNGTQNEAFADRFEVSITVSKGDWVLCGARCAPATATTTTLAAAPDKSAVVGTRVKLTATVTPAGAAGRVRFTDGTADLGEAEVSGAVATLTVDSLAVGAHSVTAVFVPGSSSFVGSTSAALKYTITAVAESPSPSPSPSASPSTSASTAPSASPAPNGSGGGGSLPITGVSVPTLVGAGLALIAAGIGATVLTGRRRAV